MSFRKEIEGAIAAGVDFLLATQRKSGEIPLRATEDLFEGVWRYDQCVFGTAMAIECLRPVGGKTTRQIIRAGQSFLMSAMESGGLWRYRQGEDIENRLPPDVDDTVYASLALRDCDRAVLEAIAGNIPRILACRDETGRFLTWIGHSPWRNDVDPVVNANVLRYLGESEDTGGAVRQLIRVVETGRICQCNRYYVGALPFWYATAKARASSPSLRVKTDLILVRLDEICEGISDLSVLESALLVSAWCSCTRVLNSKILFCASQVLESQEGDGGWEVSPLYGEPPPPVRFNRWYGSRALTSAICLEALALVRRIL